MTTTPPSAAPGQFAGWVPPPAPPMWQPAVAPNGQPLAGFGDRFLAYLIDYAIYFAILIVCIVPFLVWYIVALISAVEEAAAYEPGSAAYDNSMDVASFVVPLLLMIVVSFTVGIGYTYLYYVEYQLRKNGQTLGKKMMKLRVIPVDPQQRLTRRDLAMRWLVHFIGGMFVPLFSYLDGFWQLWDKPLQQCLHDKAAKTVVVKVG